MLLAKFAAGRPRLVLALFLLSTALASIGVSRLRQTDDLLDFIPPGDADVRAFREVSKTFGSLQVAVVGIEARPGDDVLSAEMVTKVGAATEAVKGVHGVDGVVSLTSLPDFQVSPMGVQVVPLIDGPPTTPAAHEALRNKVMAKEYVIGAFIAPDARATMMLVPIASGVSQRSVAHGIRAACEKTFGDLHVIYGGVAFAQAAIFEETDADLLWLTPLAVFLILGVVVISFRDPVGVALTVTTVAWASLMVLGAMGLLNEPFTVVSGTLPVILFASGSSYAVHLLGRYYADGGAAYRDGVVRAAKIVGPPLAIAAGTTSAGFFSFLVMDIRPMRTFGLESAFGVLACYFASMTLVPAVISLWPRKQSRPMDLGALGERLASITAWAQRRRWYVLGGAALLGLASIGPMLRVEVRMEPRAFFSKGSDPWLADKFFEERFGGSQLLQVAFGGDMTDPATLMEIQRLGQFARTLPGVTQVFSIAQPLELVSEVMGAGKRLPETPMKITNLYLFIEGQASLRMVLAPGRHDAAVQIRVSGDVQPALKAMEEFIATRVDRRPGQLQPAGALERLGFIAKANHTSLPPGAAEAAVALSHPLTSDDPRLLPIARAETLAVLGGDDGLLPPLADHERAERIANLVATADPMAKAEFLAAAPSPEEGMGAWQALHERIHEKMRESVVDFAMEKIEAALPVSALPSAREVLADLLPSKPIPKTATPITILLAGEPVLDRGFARSVASNQEKSLIVSLVAVVLLMFALFRSPYLAVVSVLPSALWMAAVFGAMGLARVPIDISTSLVASIATGAGSDFAMHYLWYFLKRSPEEAVKVVGPVMAIAALLVSAGFAVLALGKSQPMRMFGSLAAVAMAGSFLLTFLLVPALLRKVDRPAFSPKEAP